MQEAKEILGKESKSQKTMIYTRINLMIGDARNFLLLSKEKYDLITIEQDFTQILQPGVEGSAAPVHKLKPLLI